MPFIKLISGIANHKRAYLPGHVLDWPDEGDVARMCERGIAIELTPAAAILEQERSGVVIKKVTLPAAEPAPAKKPGIVASVGELLKNASTRFMPALVKDD